MRLRDIILRLVPATWRAEMIRDSKLWIATCNSCGNRASIWDIGGLRWKATGDKAITTRCPACGKFAGHRVDWTGG